MKTIWKLCILWTVAIPPFLFSSLSGQDTPKTMMKISTRVIEPAPEAGSFMAQTKICWRAGVKYARIAEAPDPQHHIHGLMIISEPDAWMINLYTNAGKHLVDPGPSFEVHIPIFQIPGEAKMKLHELEFGKEMEFVNANHGARSEGGVIQGKATDRYEVTVNAHKLILWTESETGKPVRISLVRGVETQTIEYIAYENNLPFESSLFEPPAAIRIENNVKATSPSAKEIGDNLN